VARWSGWGAGPAGAGSTGGPSRAFLGVALAGSVLVTAALAREGNVAGAGLTAAAVVYFALRLFAGLGRGKR
jgi:hypothetical protein